VPRATTSVARLDAAVGARSWTHATIGPVARSATMSAASADAAAVGIESVPRAVRSSTVGAVAPNGWQEVSGARSGRAVIVLVAADVRPCGAAPPSCMTVSSVAVTLPPVPARFSTRTASTATAGGGPKAASSESNRPCGSHARIRRDPARRGAPLRAARRRSVPSARSSWHCNVRRGPKVCAADE
jgi:hypothetical protein